MSLGPIDLAVLVVYFVATLAIGLWFGCGEKNTGDFFLGGRRQHWLLAGVSIIATEVSALTLIAVPAEAFKGDWNYLQMYAGAFLGRILIVLLLLPAFYGGQVTTVYEYLGQRFGPWTRTTASLMFFASRIIGSGVRLLVASLAISEVFGWPLVGVVVGTAGVAMLYATYGGIKAILWTDAFQATIFISAAVAAIVVILRLTPGSWSENFATAYEAGKFHTFTWDANANNARAFWVLLIHATVLNMAALGTDQDLTQRMLTCKNLRDGQKSLLFNAFAGLPIVCVFLTIGALLFVYYQTLPAGALPDRILDKTDRIFPYFIATALPHNVGLKGLLVTAVFAAAMSSLSSALGALSSTAVTDFYRVLRRAPRSERHYLLVARIFTFAFGVLLIFVALAFAGYDQLLWEVFKWVGLVFGGMLGVFLLGVTTRRRGRDALNALAMTSSVVVLVVLKLYQEQPDPQTGEPLPVLIAWPWWVVVGTGWTYLWATLFRTRNPTNPAG
ncbi:MAG: sodium/solute symporter [Phycisphaerales bacterium]|nr:sodium/solute symporter [Phycisphaerales bacterium]